MCVEVEFAAKQEAARAVLVEPAETTGQATRVGSRKQNMSSRTIK